MDIYDIEKRTESLLHALQEVWEASVRATHLFLSEEEIQKIAAYVPAALMEIPHLVVANAASHPVGFMGISGRKLEMLFIVPEARGKGLGKELIRYGIENYGIHEVCVNEQNPQAKGFYEYLGFRVYKRTDCDEQGNPWPILYMRLEKAADSMVLIFGGTTEGRAAVEVLDGAGKPYYYSTRSDRQQVECTHGIHLSGEMDGEQIVAFCRERNIRLLVDAAHPFAVQLHRHIAMASEALDIPVVRYERRYPSRDERCIWCETYEEAVTWLQEHAIRNLLALSGVQTIARLKPYWEKHPCWFRVLQREESVQLAVRQGFPAERLVYYEEGKEAELLERLQPDAILTKESGESGFFTEKVQAALERHIPVLAVKRPALPEGFYIVTGPSGLRHRVERLLPGFFALRSGYTTGSCACAAAKAALWTLLTGQELTAVSISLPSGEAVTLPVYQTMPGNGNVLCAVLKDAGDDPDVTHGKEIRAKVSLSEIPGVHFKAGEGVGRVTLPGLGLDVGEPAINPVPRQMMVAETKRILAEHSISSGVVIEISVPGGEELAQKTFNPKLGIVGGISIIGTSGVVRPFSSEAFVDTIRKEIQVGKALGCRHIVINSGAKSERILKERFPDLLPQAFVHYGNYIGETLKIAEEEKIDQITMGIMIGKAVKLAEGNTDTHSRNVVMNREFIAALAQEAGCSPELLDRIRQITLARELWTLLPATHTFFPLLVQKCREVCRGFYGQGKLEIILIPENRLE